MAANTYFSFKKFTIDQNNVAMKVGTDGVLLGAWAKGGTRILDIGCGTGLISLMMAQRFPEADVVAIDIEPMACRQAVQNVENSIYRGRVEVINMSISEYYGILRDDAVRYFRLYSLQPAIFQQLTEVARRKEVNSKTC